MMMKASVYNGQGLFLKVRVWICLYWFAVRSKIFVEYMVLKA